MFATFLSSWSPERVAAFLGALIPVVTALPYVGARVRAIIAAALAVISGPIAMVLSGPGSGIVSWVSARSAALAWAVSLLTYLAAWKPLVAVNTRVAVARGKVPPDAAPVP